MSLIQGKEPSFNLMNKYGLIYYRYLLLFIILLLFSTKLVSLYKLSSS